MSIVIDKISFENYRQYGTASISFHPKDKSKMSVLIAKNGTGKTTLLNAITWCLYDKELHLADEENALPLVNKTAAQTYSGNDKIPVSVTVRISDDNNAVEFKRLQNFITKIEPTGKISYIKDNSKFTVSITPEKGFTNTIIRENDEANIEVKKYFDEAIFNYYFFDGERLRDFFAPEKAKVIKESIFNISQVTLLENICTHLKTLYKEHRHDLSSGDDDLAKLNDECEKEENRLKNAENSLSDSEDEIKRLQAEIDRLDHLLRGYEPIKKLQQEREQLESELKIVEEEEKELRDNKTEFIRNYYVLLSLYPRISHTLELIEKKEENGDLPPEIDRNLIQQVLDNPDEPCPLCKGKIDETGREHLKFLINKISVSSKSSNFLMEIKGSLENFVKKAHLFDEKSKDLLKKEKETESRKNTICDNLKKISGVLIQYQSENNAFDVSNLESERIKLNKKLQNEFENEGVQKNIIKICEENLKEIEEKIAKAIKMKDENSKIRKQMEVIKMLQNEFTKIKDQIVGEMKSEIEETTWSIFDSMIWKKHTFGGIEIDDSYNVSVYNTDGLTMTGSLSATEQMALAYAFTLAIHKASGKNCPLVIDSPLGRVSDDNRENMAKALQKVSQEKQIIMLFTPDEYSESVRALYNDSAEVRTLSLSEDESHIEGLEK